MSVNKEHRILCEIVSYTVFIQLNIKLPRLQVSYPYAAYTYPVLDKDLYLIHYEFTRNLLEERQHYLYNHNT